CVCWPCGAFWWALNWPVKNTCDCAKKRRLCSLFGATSVSFISFDVFRTLGFKNTQHIKPAHYLQHTDALAAADRVLFPEYWQVNALVFGLGCRIFPSLATYLIGHNKVEMTRAL